MADISVKELNEKMSKGESVVLIDVREQYEYEAANLGGRLIPLGTLAAKLPELEPYKNEEIIVHCRSGARSANAVAFLKQHGFVNPRNLIGGILAWKAEIDPKLQV